MLDAIYLAAEPKPGVWSVMHRSLSMVFGIPKRTDDPGQEIVGMEVLRQRGVRLIAINDGVDSLKGDDDFTPFRNIMNEFYARDTSRKIRSVFKSKGMSGKHLTGTVIYGYLWDEKREHWLVDEEATEVVRRIFSLTLEGYGPYQIACKLSTDRIEIPVVHLARFNEGVNRSKPVKDPYGWGSSTIVNILKKREYLGHTINFKTRKHFIQYISFKNDILDNIHLCPDTFFCPFITNKTYTCSWEI